MDAQRFYGDADGPDLVIGRAGDGAPLAECRGWTCECCEAIWATKEMAEACCLPPDLMGTVCSLTTS